MMRGAEPRTGRSAILEIDLDAVTANWQTLRRRHPAGAVAAVVKADAYGLGARHVAPRLFQAGCRHFFVATLDEALAIRDLVPGAMLAVFNGVAAASAAEFAGRNVTPVINSLAEVEVWAAEARRLGRKLVALLHIDTGMSRLGLDARELAILAEDRTRIDGIEPSAIMTHLVSAELPEDERNALQLRRFAAACAMLPPAPRSLANSSGIFLGPDFASDIARPGAALYGLNPTPKLRNPMRLAVTLKAPVLQVRDIAAGDTVGYNATWRAERASRIGTVAIGYADGWPRSLSGRGGAAFDGRPVPLVGRVSMDLATYDLTELPEIGPGAWLELIGPASPPDAVAEWAGTNGYEILTSLGSRCARIVKGA